MNINRKIAKFLEISHFFNLHMTLGRHVNTASHKSLEEGLNGGLHLFCRLKFPIFVGSRLDVSIFVGRRKISANNRVKTLVDY